MKHIQKIHHLIRYFVVFGLVAFAGYLFRWQDDVFLFLLGPVIYAAFEVKQLVASVAGGLPSSQEVNQYGFLLPMTLVYAVVTSFLLKQLLNERGWVRHLTVYAYVAFLLFIHYRAWQSLSGYFTLHA